MKINVDAAISKSLVRGASATVCRDDTGKYLGGSALVIEGISDVATLKAIACREGLALALDMLIQNTIIASNSK